MLRPTREVERGDWLKPRLRPWGVGLGTPVAAVVPDGFEAYARILHPVHDGDSTMTWAAACAESGATPHAAMQWTSITPARLVQRASPDHGSLDHASLTALVSHLRAEGDITYAFWEGWGDLNGGAVSFGWAEDGTSWSNDIPALSPFGDLDFPGLGLPARGYVLFRGPLAPVVDLRGDAPRDEDGFVRGGWARSASLFWPDDHAWCVATEVDFDSTLIGGTQELIAAILADERLEAWPIDPGADLSIGGDHING